MIKRVGFTLAVITGALLLSACSPLSFQAGPTPTPAATAVPTRPPVQRRPTLVNAQAYPQYVEQNFMANCLQQSANRGGCLCALRGLERRYTLGDFADIERQATRTGQLPNEYYSIVQDCTDAN
jgi:hypothetical protein